MTLGEWGDSHEKKGGEAPLTQLQIDLERCFFRVTHGHLRNKGRNPISLTTCS